MNKKGMAVSQIFLLVLGIIAIAFFAGMELPVVSAADNSVTNPDEACSSLGGSCANITVQSCQSITGEPKNFEIGKCSGGNNRQCCVGKLVLKNEIYDKVANQEHSQPETSSAVATTGTSSDGTTSITEKGTKLYTQYNMLKGAYKELLGPSKPDISTGVKVAGEEAGKAIIDEAAKEEALKKLTGSNTFLQKFKNGFFNRAPAKSSTANIGNPNAISTGGYIIQTAAFAAAGAAIAVIAFKLAGAGERNMEQIKKGAYVAAAATTVTLVAIKMASSASAVPIAGAYVVGIVAAATALWAAITYQDYSREIFSYELNVWQPESKGEKCTECNDLRYGCSEYQCKSFGAGCGILNQGTEEEYCDWINPNDVKPPIMTQLNILEKGYSYNPNEQIKLPDRGVELVYNNGCIPAFTSVKFGVETDEPAECKIDLERKFSYDEMISLMSEGPIYVYNHTLEIPSSAFPSNYSLTEAGWTVNAGKEHSFYIRCKDANDNISPYHMVINFCVDQGPDTTAPTIRTNYLNGAYISYNQSTIDDLEVYTNEPADCRWDYKDLTYDEMEQSMTECSKKIGEYTFPNTYSYGCKTSINGLKNGEQNKFYIRCQDKPLLKEGSQERRVANEESYELVLQGTNQLVIESISVDGNPSYEAGKQNTDKILIQDSTDVIAIDLQVETTQGSDKLGSARCSYSPTGSNLRYEFYNNGNFDYVSNNLHTLNLRGDDYNYTIQCCDMANNCDTASTAFTVNTDILSPVVARAYYEEGNMKIVTDEDSECAYMLETCNYLFEDGVAFTTKDNREHFITWDTSEDLYVKCKDRFGNVPAKDCSIIVRATNKYKGENKAVKDTISLE